MLMSLTTRFGSSRPEAFWSPTSVVAIPSSFLDWSEFSPARRVAGVMRRTDDYTAVGGLGTGAKIGISRTEVPAQKTWILLTPHAGTAPSCGTYCIVLRVIPGKAS